jgi:hypothetical protein
VAVEKGDEAPDFELPDQDGEPVRLSDLRGTPPSSRRVEAGRVGGSARAVAA